MGIVSSSSGRVVAALAGGIAAAVIAAIAFTLADLYATGHGMASISRPLVESADWGIHLHSGDVAMLVSAALGAWIGWRCRPS